MRTKLATTTQISINTLLNVLLSYFFNRYHLQNTKTYLSIPTHLSPYFAQDIIYPYNFITNIDVYINTPQKPSDLAPVATVAQETIGRIQKNGSLVNKVEKALSEYQSDGKVVIDTLKKMYLSWFEKIEQTYVVSNLGIVDTLIPTTLREVVRDHKIFISAPSIGAQPITLFVVRVGRQLNLSWTIDAARLQPELINMIMDELSVKNVENLIQSLGTTQSFS